MHIDLGHYYIILVSSVPSYEVVSRYIFKWGGVDRRGSLWVIARVMPSITLNTVPEASSGAIAFTLLSIWHHLFNCKLSIYG